MIHREHDDNNHFGYVKTLAALRETYFWPGMVKDVEQYFRTCALCALNKSSTQLPAGFQHPIPIPANRFMDLALDFVSRLPTSKGFDSILGMTDRLTRYVKLEPLKSTASAREVAEIVYRSWYRQFGLPEFIVSDRDKLFTSHFWQELFKKLKIRLRMSTSFHPETDGSSERTNKTFIESLRHYINVGQSEWADHLVNVEIRMNNARNATTGMSPTELVFGSPLRLTPTQRLTSTTLPAVSEFLERIHESTQVAKDSHIVAKTRQAIQSNKDRREEAQCALGDKVYLDTRNIHLKVKQKGRSTKLYLRFVGPFTITHINHETSTSTLDLPSEFKIHPRFHAKLIKPVHENDPALFPDREVTVPPPIDAEDNQWEV